jgi:hypothetical protein
MRRRVILIEASQNWVSGAGVVGRNSCSALAGVVWMAMAEPSWSWITKVPFNAELGKCVGSEDTHRRCAGGTGQGR